AAEYLHRTGSVRRGVRFWLLHRDREIAVFVPHFSGFDVLFLDRRDDVLDVFFTMWTGEVLVGDHGDIGFRVAFDGGRKRLIGREVATPVETLDVRIHARGFSRPETARERTRDDPGRPEQRPTARHVRPHRPWWVVRRFRVSVHYPIYVPARINPATAVDGVRNENDSVWIEYGRPVPVDRSRK